MTRNSVKFGYFTLSNIFGDVAGGQKIIGFIFIINFRSQLFELCHIFDGSNRCF